MTTKTIIDKLNSALEEFGTYSFDDKGPDEVMDIDSITNKLKKKSADKAGAILKELAASNDERQVVLAEFLVSCMDTMPDDWFERVLEISGVKY